MPEEKKTYIVDNTPVDVDAKDVQSFLKFNPNAKEAKSFTVGGDTVDVMVEDLDGFLKSVPNAKPLFAEIKPSPKKGVEEVISNYGTGFLGKQSAVPSPSVSGGSATKKPSKEQPSTSQLKEDKELIQYRKENLEQVKKALAGDGAFPETFANPSNDLFNSFFPSNMKLGGKEFYDIKEKIKGKTLKEVKEEFGIDIQPEKPVVVEGEIRLPTEAEFATIEKMPLTKEAKLKEAVRLGTPPVQRATQDIKSNKAKILSSEEELNKLEKELATYKQQSDSLLSTYNNEQLSPEERNKAGQEYNKVNEVAKPIEDRRNELYGSYQGYINNQKVLFNELDKAEKMRQKGLEKDYNYVQNLLESTASFSVKALTGVVKMESMIGDIIMSPISSPTEEMLRKNKLDTSLKLVNKFADDLITQEVPENYKKLFEGEFSAGKLGYITTNAIASTIPTIAAGFLTGGVGSVMVGAGMGYEESRSIMKDAGLTDEQAEWAAFGLAIPIGFLEKYGADDIVNLLSRSGVRKEVATELAKKLAGKTLTKEAIYLETKKTFGELIKAKTAKLITSGGKESITEMTQGELVEGVKQFVQEVTGVDKDENMSTQDYVMQQLSQRGEEGVGGFLGGTSMQGFGTAYSAIANKQEFSPSAYTKAMEYADPAMFQQFQNDLMLEVQNGVLTEAQANEAITNVQAIQETNALIPNSVQNLDLRTEAVNLIIEKNNIAKETEGKDPDLIAPENARLAEIKKALNDISLGKKPGAEEQQVKTLEDEINVGDTVDLTPKSMALKADIEERRAAELEPINLAIAESERTGEVPVVNGEPVNKKTIDDINAKYDAEIDSLNKPAPTAESQPQAEATTEENVGKDRFKSTAFRVINEERDRLLSNIEYYKQRIEEEKPKTILDKLSHKINRRFKDKGILEESLSEVEAELNELDANPIEYFKRRKENNPDEETKQYFQDKIDYLEENKITPDNIWEYSNDPIEDIKEQEEDYKRRYNKGDYFYESAIATLDKIKNDPIGLLKERIEFFSELTPDGGWTKEEIDAIINDFNTKIKLLEQEASTGQAAPQAQAAPLFEAPTIEAPQTLPEVENAIADLRQQEQAENEETYNRYDEAITPLLEQEEELKAQAPTTETQAPESFPAQEGAESEQKRDGVNAELEQIYRDLQAAVNKNIDEQTIRILKANPSKAMVDKAMEILKKKGIIEVDCN